MFDFDSLREILSTISKNKLRTTLTGFAVAWGIFMLIILLGAGNGLKNGVTSNFAGRAQNSIVIFPGYTSMPYKGLPNDRRIVFDDNTYNFIRNKIPGVKYVSPRVSQSVTLSYGEEYGTWSLYGVTEDVVVISNITVKSGDGRFINKIDMDDRRKVIVINSDIKKVLFKDKDPIGERVIANNLVYTVVGIYDDSNQWGNTPPAYIPFSTAQMLYNKGYGFSRIEFTVDGLNTLEENEAFTKYLRGKLGVINNFDGNDQSAVYIRNRAEESIQANGIFWIINMFIIVIGAASLMAGVVGVGNIMLITVKERTREIGIRKALGATPASVLRLIILESLFITTAAGYIGLVGGVAIVELINMGMSGGGGASDGPTMFKDPSVDMMTVVIATIVLIISGVIAGLIPAVKATKVSPIEAMRDE